MKSLLILAAAVIPKEKHIEDVKEAAINASINPNKENVDKLLLHCHMLLIAEASKGDVGNAAKMISEIELMEKRKKMFDPDSN